MPAPRSRLLPVARSVLTALIVANWIAGFAFAVVLVFTWARSDFWLDLLARQSSNPADLLHWIRVTLALALATVPFAWLVFDRLRQIVRSVEAGSPFSPANGRALRRIGWGLLALQLIDLGFGWVSARMGEEGGPFGWSFGLTGWLAVLLLFVLAEVFEHGAAIDDELAGTV